MARRQGCLGLAPRGHSTLHLWESARPSRGCCCARRALGAPPTAWGRGGSLRGSHLCPSILPAPERLPLASSCPNSSAPSSADKPEPWPSEEARESGLQPRLLAPFSCPSVTGHPPTARPGVLCPSFVHSTHDLEPLTKTPLGSLPKIPPRVWCPSCGLRAHSLAHGPLPRQLSYCSVLLVDKPAPPAPQAPGDRDRDRFCSLSCT